MLYARALLYYNSGAPAGAEGARGRSTIAIEIGNPSSRENLDVTFVRPSLVPRRSPPLSGEREGHVRAWERVGVPAGERLVKNGKSTPEFHVFTPVFNSIFWGSDSKH